MQYRGQQHNLFLSMTRYTLTFKRFACPSCGTENLVQAVKSINTLVQGLTAPSGELLSGEVHCTGCDKKFDISSAQFLGWVDENTSPNPADVDKYAVPAFLKRFNDEA